MRIVIITASEYTEDLTDADGLHFWYLIYLSITLDLTYSHINRFCQTCGF
jgi:hypothetical protein